MITPEEFPYVTPVFVDDCFTYKDLDIKLNTYKPFSHLILTGKNGSGKTTILNAINTHLSVLLGLDPDLKGNPTLLQSSLYSQLRGATMEGGRTGWKNIVDIENKSENYDKLRKIKLYDYSPYSTTYGDKFIPIQSSRIVFSYFKARRDIRVNLVETPTKESNFTEALSKPDSGKYLSENFQQYLVNKKVAQAFDRLDNKEDNIRSTEQFFEKLTETFRSIFDDNRLTIEFVRERYETPLKLFDERTVTFNTLPAGYSGILRIILDLFIRVDLVRKQIGNNTHDPCGIVLVDEPEVHLHLELQEQVMPLLTKLFPNIQFIIATHSPAVIASIKNATIFDLTTKEIRVSEDVVGRSYSELMVSHFGINNEYSTIADDIFKKVRDALRNYKDQPEKRNEIIQQVLIENESLLSPSFRVELESILLEHV